jgi:hypothetical protein
MPPWSNGSSAATKATKTTFLIILSPLFDNGKSLPFIQRVKTFKINEAKNMP